MKRQRYFLSSRKIWVLRVIVIGNLLVHLTGSIVAQAVNQKDLIVEEDFAEELLKDLPEDLGEVPPEAVEEDDLADKQMPSNRGEHSRSSDTFKVDEWREGFEGMGTVHEQMGVSHWPEVQYTKYEYKTKFHGQTIHPKMGMEPIFNFTHYIFQNTLTDPPYIPDGYVVTNNRDILMLGQKSEMNDWRDLLWRYFLYLVWVAFLLTLIIIIPFIGVCYCCFCCCRRCSKGCPPCTRSRETRLRYVYGLLLFILIVPLIVCTVVAFLTNKMIDRGMKESTYTMRRSSEDICRYQEDVRKHIYHLFANNYEELMNHLNYLLTNAHDHIFLDMSDSSDASGLQELKRIMDNMVSARVLMTNVNVMEKEMRYLISQLRDGVRGVKREITYSCHMSAHPRCQDFLKSSSIEFIDTTRCIHIDQLPNSTVYLTGMNYIIDKRYTDIPNNAILRLQAVKDAVSKELKRAAPPIKLNLQRGRDVFLYKANVIRGKIDTVLNDLYFSSLRSSESFENLYEKYANDRSAVNLIVCIILALISVILISGLICGCAASKQAGAVILLFALIVIFCALSFIILVGLFYFIMGLFIYGGACEPSGHLRKLDTLISVGHGNNASTDMQIQQATMALQGCGLNKNVFNILHDNSIYDVTELAQIELFDDKDFFIGLMYDDFSEIKLILEEEKLRLTEIINGSLSTYRSQLYTQNICAGLTPRPLTWYSEELRSIVTDLYSGYYSGHWNVRVALNNAAMSLDVYHNQFVIPIQKLQESMRRTLNRIDSLILYNNNNFGFSIKVLLQYVVNAEKFIQSKGKYFVRELVRNLTMFCAEQTDEYIEMLIVKCNKEVGPCEPLAKAYQSSVHLVCENLVDPINGFWLGVLCFALVLLPLLFVLHRLMCLYRIYSPAPAGFVGTCPVCISRAPGGYDDNARITLPDNPQLGHYKRKKKD